MIKDMHFLALCNSCSRLGLVSLSYLWRREQAELLKEMIDNGVTAIVIKVASMGKYIAHCILSGSIPLALNVYTCMSIV